MRKIIILVLLAIAITVFAQTDINWWVFDGGGGMRVPASGDTIWVSIGQNAIGPSFETTTYLGAGYLYSESETTKIIDKSVIPGTFTITSIAPNPFNSSCAIEFEISEECDVAIDMIDMQGKKIMNIANERDVKAGKYRIRWNAGELSSGVYFVRLNAGDRTITKRAVLMK